MAINAIIGALRVNLGLDSAEFEEGLRNAQAGLARAGQQLAKVGAAVATATAGAMAGVGVAVNDAMGDIREIDEAARAIGLTVEELAALRYAAEQTNIGFDALVDGFKEMQLRADEFVTTGGGSAEEAFTRLGITVEDLATRLSDPVALFDELITRMREIPAAAQIRIADEIFGGTGGEQFVRLLADGARGLGELRAEAEQLGLVVSGETATSVRLFDSSMRQLGGVMDGISRQFTAALAPGLAAIVQHFADAARSGGGFGEVIRTVAAGAVDGALWTIDAWDRLKLVWPALETGAMAFAATVQRVARAVAEQLTAVTDGIASRINSLIEAANSAGANLPTIGSLGDTQWFATITANANEAEQAFARARLRLGLLVQQPPPSEAIRATMAGIAEGATRAADAFRAGGEAIQAGASQIAAGAGGARRAVDELKAANENMAKSGEQLANSLAGQFSSMFSGLIQGTQTAGEAIRGLVAQLGQMLLNKGFQALFSSMGGGGGLFGAIGKLFAGGFADGGTIPANRFAVVGERGPELIYNGGMARQVVPNHELGGGWQGGPIPIEVFVSPTGEFDARVAGIADQRASVVVKANNRNIPGIVQNAQKRTG